MNWTSELMIQENLRKRDLRVEENQFQILFFKSATDSFPYYYWHCTINIF
jgi:hypothetical protein